MVAKVLGLATGALVASAAVWAFNDWRHVSDDDLLTLFLQDHCLPYVQTGQVPFDGLGRTPGVYDEVERRQELEQAGVVLLSEGRFIGEWGVARDPENTLRVCDVKPSYAQNTVAGFEVEAGGFVARYTAVIATAESLRPEIGTLVEGPRTLGWYGSDRGQSEGLRVVMVASPGLVTSFIVVGEGAD